MKRNLRTRVYRTGLGLICASAALSGCQPSKDAASSLGESAAEIAGVESVADVIIDSVPQCQGCSVEVERFATLRVDGSNGYLLRLPWLHQDSRGRFIVAPLGAAGYEPVFVLDSSGSFLFVVGSAGRGPGEIAQTGPVMLGEQDSLFVAADARRINVYSPTGTPVRQTTMQFVSTNCLRSLGGELAPLPTGRVLVGVGVSTKEHFATPIFLAGADGELVQAMGMANTSSPSTPSCRSLAWDGARREAWAAEPYGYRLELLREQASGAFVTVRQIGVIAPWLREGRRPLMNPEELAADVAGSKMQFVPWSPSERPTRLERPPTATLRNMAVDSLGRLWVAWRVPAEGWDTVTLRYEYADEATLGDELDDALFDTVVDVIDTQRDRLLLRRRFPFHAQLATAGVLAHPYYETGTGEPVIDVWHIRFSPSR